MKSFIYHALFAPLMVAAVASCTHIPDEFECPSSPTPFQLDVPAYFPAMIIPSGNPLTVEGQALGRRLYYDPLLSAGGPKNGKSCSSCHSQESGFTINEPQTAVLAHVNLGWATNFLWEGKVNGGLEYIMRFEVEQFFQTDMRKLREHDEYPVLFRNAFGQCEITAELVAKALSQWFRRLSSFNSRYDRFMRHEIQLTAAELRGFNIFMTEKGDCFHCHTPPLFTDNSFRNIGLDSIFEPEDLGRYNITGMPADRGLFKTPTLRNIGQTWPYMHDGRFNTLDEVIEHYNSGVCRTATTDPIMTKPGKEFGLMLSDQDKADLVAFLLTLTDETFLGDTALSNPL